MKKLIIGLGTGRCGSLSLSSFLSDQQGIQVLHEGNINDKPNPFKWENDYENILQWIEELENNSNSNQYFGDTGMYFLPYVSSLITQFPDIRFICLKRNRQEVINSFLVKTQDRNHWCEHDGKIWKKDPVWDSVFPKFNEPDKAKVLGLYWDMYYEEIDRLILEYPEHICCLSTESLNSLIGRNEILDFIGYKGERKVNGNYIKNKHDDFNSFYKHSLNILLWMGRHTLPKSVRHLLWKIIGKNLYNYINW